MKNKIILILLFVSINIFATRIKDISYIKGVKTNDLLGYGIVVGLDGTGDDDKAIFTVKSLASMLQKMGVKIDEGSLKVKNVAAVIVTAKLPPFSKIGSNIDVEVSSIGNAKSLNGGVLIMTPLKGLDGNVYGIAQGNISITGYSIKGKSGSQAIKNYPTVGRVPNGATIEKEIENTILKKEFVEIVLNNPDFTTSYRVSKTINEQLGDVYAESVDSNLIKLKIPEFYKDNVIKLIALIENLQVKVDTNAKIVINERTGTIIIGDNVTISSVAIAHGNINIIIEEKNEISQPLPFTMGQTTNTQTTTIKITEDKANFSLLQDKVTLKDLIQALNSLGVSPKDLIAIIQAIKEAGALQADLEII